MLSMSTCVAFFILVSSISLGLSEDIQGGLDPFLPPDSQTPQETALEDPEAREVDEDTKQTLVHWLYVISLASFVAAAAGIANILLVSMHQRKKEIGILRAVGISREEVGRLFILDALWMVLMSFIIGVLAGLILSNNIFNWMFVDGRGGMFFAPARTPPVLVLSALVICLFVGAAAAYYPAKKASAMDPVAALRG